MPDAVYEKHNPYTLSDWINYLSHGEIDLLTKLAQSLPAGGVIINIGAGAGTSGLTFLGARPDLWLYTVDVQKALTVYGGLENEIGILAAAGLLDYNRYLPIHGDSVKVGQGWDRGPVDLVFVDGDHSYAGCRGDIEAWWPHLRPGGMMALHDYQKTESWSRHHPDTPVTDELLWREIKPYADVDQAVHDRLLNREAPAGHVDTLIAFRKAGAHGR